MSVVEKILAHAESNPSNIAIRHKDQCITYDQLANDIERAATKLSSKVNPQDAVLLTATNDYAFIVTYFAVHYVGAMVVNTAADIDEKTKLFIKSRSNPTLCIDSCNDFIQDLGEYACADTKRINQASYADLMFTSGTTGEPKGIALTHEQLTLAVEHIIEQVGNTSNDIELLLMPLSHSFGMGRMRTTLYAGGSLVVGYPLQRLKSVFKALETHQVTGFGLVPSAWSFITQMSKSLITKFASQLNYIEFGSAYLSPEDKRELTEWFPETHIVMHYGLTEVSRAIFTHFHSDEYEAVGHSSRGAEFIILKEDGSKALPGEVGEIAFKAPWMFSEYYQNEALTAQSFIDGYFKTGDLGKYQGDYLYLTGRLKEIINVGGKKVSPYQVEESLIQSDYVQEVACVALKDPAMGEVVQAFIVLSPDNSVPFEDVVDALKCQVVGLPTHMRPQLYKQVDTLPKTASGKIQRLQLASL